MTRLQRPQSSFLRMMQMSENQLWILVEGKEVDGHFYGLLAESIEPDFPEVKYEIATAAEITGSGGKSVLLALHDHLRSTKRLVSDLSGKRTTTCFFLDKDIDDLIGGRRRSMHVTYTDGYSVENYLFEHGDVARALASVLAVPSLKVKSVMGDQKKWRVDAQENWRHWVTLCILSCRLEVPNLHTFSRHSMINHNRFGPVDQRSYDEVVQQAESHAKDTDVDFEAMKARIVQIVQRLYDRGQADRIFNGKWYPYILEHHASTWFPQRRKRTKLVPSSICSVLMHGSNFRAPWAKRLRERLTYHFRLVTL